MKANFHRTGDMNSAIADFWIVCSIQADELDFLDRQFFLGGVQRLPEDLLRIK